MKVINEYGYEFDFEAVIPMMDDDIREALHQELAPCADQTFFDAYCKRHEKKFGEPFELAKPNPTY